MEDSTKGLIGGLAACLTLVGCFALMADCSKEVARVGGERAADCARSSGEWVSFSSSIDSGSCVHKAQR